MLHFVLDVAASGEMLPFGDTVLTAVLGYAVVFLGLLILMAIVYAMGAIFKAKAARRHAAVSAHISSRKGPKVPTATLREPAPAPAAPALPEAPGTAGEVKLFDVPDKEAAMIMAIVADQMGKPLNELRFKSIKEVK